MSKILVTGGCGYIGSHTVIDLLEHGFEVISVDSNIRSDAHILNSIEAITNYKVPNYCIDICELEKLQYVFERNKDITAIIHFAAFKSVPESVATPLRYYHNNIAGLVNVLECVKQFDIPHFIFSSSCSVYGNAAELPVIETTPLNKAESPYASTKQMCERIIQDFAKAHPSTRNILLRYFNPAGAHLSGLIGEIPQKGAYNVVPILVESLLGKRGQFVVTGDKHDTPDGTCVRDYIHVMDVANAHTKCLQYLQKGVAGSACEVFNIGTGRGVSILELIEAFDRATGQKLDYRIGEKRAGDVSAIYSDYTKAKEKLGWEPQYKVDDIMASAWKWTQNNKA